MFSNFYKSPKDSKFEAKNRPSSAFSRWLGFFALIVSGIVPASAATFFSQGSAGFSVLANWNTIPGGGGSNPVAGDLTSGAHTFVIQNGNVVTVDQDITVLELTVGTTAPATAGSLVVGNNTTARVITVRGGVLINALGSMTSDPANLGNHTLSLAPNVGGSALTVNGVLNLTASTTSSSSTSTVLTNLAAPLVTTYTFNGSATAANYKLANLTVAPASSTMALTLDAGVTFGGNVTLSANGSMNGGSFYHYLLGNWNQSSATSYTSTGTIEFASSTVQIVSNASVNFNNVVMNNLNGTVLFSSSVNILGNLTFASGAGTTLQMSANVTHTLSGNLVMDASCFINQTTGTMHFNGSGPQNIQLLNTTFFAVTFSNGGLANPKTLVGNLTCNSLMTINSTASVLGNGDHTISNGLTLNGSYNLIGNAFICGGTIQSANPTANIGSANLIIQPNSPFGGGTVYIASSNTPGTFTFEANSNVTVSSGGQLVIGNNTATNQAFLTGQSGTVFSVNTGANLYVRGSNNFPTGFGDFFFGTGTNVIYDAPFNQTITGGVSASGADIVMNNMSITGAFTKTLAGGDLRLTGNLTLNSGVTANLLGADVYVQGSINTNASGTNTLNNDGTLYLNNPGANQNIGGTNMVFNLNNFNISNDSPVAIVVKTFLSNVLVTGNFIATNAGGSSVLPLIIDLGTNQITNTNLALPAIGTGSFTLDPFVRIYSSGLTSFRNSILSFLSVNLDASSTIRYNNGTAYSIQLIAEGITYGNLEISGSGIYNYKSACGDLNILGNFSNVGGIPVFRDSVFNVNIGGDYYLLSANYPNPRANAVFTFNGDYQVIGNGSSLNLPNVVFGGVAGSTKYLNLLSGAVLVYGNLTISNNIVVDANSRSIQMLSGNFSNTNGIFLQTTGTTTFNAPANFQSVTTNASSSFGNLTINKTGTNTGPSPTQRTLQLLTNTNVAGTLNFTANAADLDMSNINLSVGGSINFNTGATITTIGSTLTMNGNTAQTFTNTGAIPALNNMVFSGAGSKALNTNTYNVNGYFQINSSVVTSGVVINLQGDWINNGGSFAHTSTVNLTGANQNLSASSFNNLVCAGTVGSSKTLLGALTINGSLTINSGIILDVTTQNQGLAIGGNYTNNGTFLCNTGTVTFIGGSKTINSGGTGIGKRFYNVSILSTTSLNNSLSTNDLYILNDLTISTGTLLFNNLSVNVGGNLLNSDLVNMNGTGVLNLIGTNPAYSFDPGLPTSVYRTININGANSGVTYTLINNNITTSNSSNLNINTGRLKLNGRTLTMSANNGNVNIAAAGSLEVDAGAQLLMGNGGQINNNGGTLSIVGNSLGVAQIGRSGTGASSGYVINQNSGTLAARYYLIEGTTGNGLTIINPSTLDATNNLSNGTFNNGSGTAYLTITNWNFTTFTVNNANFNAGPTRNVSRNSLLGTGSITFNGSTGSLTGPTFELDPANQINWTTSAKRWTNAIGDNLWLTAGNWNPVGVPNSGDTVYLDRSAISATYSCIINGSAQAGRLVIDNTSSANIITLTINSGNDLTVSESLNIIAANARLVQQSATSVLNVGGSFICTGTYTPNGGAINFNGGVGNYQIAPGANTLFDVSLTGSGTYSLSSNVTITNNLSVTGGTLDVSTNNYTITIGGNWTNSSPGIFLPRSGRVFMNKTGGTQTVTGGPFFNFISAGTSTKVLTSNTNFNGNVRIGPNTTINGGNNLITVLGNWSNFSTTGFTQTGGGAIQFSGTTTQAIDTAGTVASGTFAGQTGIATTFNSVVFANAGGKNIFRGFSVAGNFSISAGCGNVNTTTVQVTGTAGGQFTINGASNLFVQGANNFPSGFGTVSLATTSTVFYQSDITQTIFPTTYGNIDLRRITTGTNVSKILAGDLSILGNLNIADNTTQLDATDRMVSLAGTFGFAAGGRRILWGLNGTLNLVGPSFNFPAAYSGFGGVGTPEFNNLIIGGTGTKTMLAPLNVSGDVTIQNGISFTMQAFALTGATAQTFNLQGGATLNCAIPAPALAFPSGFSSFSFNITSTVNLNAGGGANQLISTVATYGNLNLTNTGTSTLTGNLVIAGNFNTNGATFQDAGFNITTSGATTDIRIYTPSATSTITLNGNTQALNDNTGGTLDLNNLVFANSGTKTLAQTAGNIINIRGAVTINSGVVLSIISRNLNYSGSTWANSGSYQHTGGGTFTFNGTGNQTINLGAVHTLQPRVVFSNTGGTVSFVTNGGNFTSVIDWIYTPTFTINAGATVNMGSLTHNIAGTVQNNGTWVSNNANINFSGTANQTVFTTGTFTAQNVSINSTNGRTVMMNTPWSVNNLTIGTNATLNTNTANYPITVTGNWLNTGGFTTSSATPQAVYFEANNTSTRTINHGNAQFRDVFFNQTLTAARTYQITNATLTINRQLTIGNGASLDLNGNILTLGSNNALVEVHTVQSGGSLLVSNGATLRFNNDNGNSTLNVSGTLSVIGVSPNPSRITRSTTNNRQNINILSGATIKARFYGMEFISDNGFDVQPGATVDPTDNFSDGAWSNLNTAGGAAKYYLNLNGTATTAIQNITFNFQGTPIVGVHFNVRRTVAPSVQFNEVVGGALGSFQYESDDASATTGNLLWPTSVTLTWTGAVSTDWHTSGNWSPAVVPGFNNNVTIPTSTNAPILSGADGSCKVLTISTGFLTISNDRTLNVSADTYVGTGASNGILSMSSAGSKIVSTGSWYVGTNGFLTGVSGSTITFTAINSTLTISMNAASAFQNLVFNGSNSTFSILGGIVNINGNLNIQAGTYFPTTGNYNHYLKGNFSNTGGLFNTSIAGTFNLNGTGNQTIASGVFSNLTVSGTGTKITTDSCRVMGNLLVGNGPTFEANAGSIWDLRGNVTINSAGTFNDGGNTHLFSGTTWNGLGACTQNTGTIRFTRNGTQNLNAGTFNNLTFDGNGAKVVNGNTSVYGDVTMGTGIAYLNLNAALISSLNGEGTFTMPAAGNLYIRGAANCPSNFGGYDFHTTSNTFYDVLLDQQIGPISYGNLILNNVSIKTLGNNTTVKGNLTINTSTLDVSSNNYTLFVGGVFNNNSSGSFLCNQGEVVFNGPASAGIQYIYLGNTGVKTFYDLTVDRVAGSPQVQINNNNAVLLGSLRLQSGDFNINGNTCSVSGDILVSQGNILTAGTYVMNNASGSPSLLQTNNSTLNNLTISTSNGSTVILQDGLTANGNFNLTSGTFNGNGKEVNLGNGANTINIQGTYLIGAGGKLGLGNGATCTVQTGASLEVVGTAQSVARVSNTNAGGRYNFILNGNLKARHYLFEYMNASGIRIQNTALVDNTDNLSDGTFTNGASGGVYLQMDNSQTLTINNATFATNPGGSARNVAKSVNAGAITFNNYNGIFSGPLYENDPYNLITWVAPSQVQWTGALNNDWFNNGNWSPNVVPTASIDALIVSTSIQPLITVHGAQMKKLTMNSNTSLTVNIVGPVTTPTGVTIVSDLDLTGTIYCNGPSDTLFIAGNFNKTTSGNFYPGTSTVVFNSGSGTRTINNGTSQFNNVIIKGSASYLLGSATLVSGDLTIQQGSLDVTSNNFQISVRGNWINNGTFNPRAGTVLLNNNVSTTKSINNGTSSFSTLSINATSGSIYDVAGNNLRISSNLVLNLGKLNLNNFTLFNGDNVGSDAITLYDRLDLGTTGTISNGSNSTITVNSGGNLVMVGTSSTATTKITRQTTGTYTFVVNAGGTISAQYYVIEYVNSGGLQIRPGASINATNNLSNGTFSNGAAGGTYINLQNNFADFTMNNVTFSSGPANNITRLSGSGIVTMLDASGLLSGYLYENDNPANGAGTGSIRWTYTNPVYDWTGSVSTDWNNGANWNDVFGNPAPSAPDASIIANIPNVTAASGNFPTLGSGANGACKNLVIFTGATLTVSNNMNLTVSGNMNNGGTFTVSPTSTSTITVSNIWANNGTFNPGQSTVAMTASSGVFSLTTGGSPFYNLTLNGAATFQTLSVLDITNNLLLNAGTLQVTNAAHQINVGGNWTNNATFSPGSGTVNLNKITNVAGTQTVGGSSPISFTNLRISNTGSAMKTVVLSSNIAITGNLDIVDVRCTLNSGANNINISGNWTNAGSAFVSSGTVNLVGTALQSINRTNASGESFVNLTLNNPNGARILSIVTLTGNLTLTNGTFDVSSRTLNLVGVNSPLTGSNISGSGGLSMTTGSITLNGQNNHTGTFTKGTGTFTYSGPAGLPAQTIRAVDYHNLVNSSTGARILASSGTIGVSGTFTVGTNSYTVTGSTVNFNGTGSQTIPAFQFNNLSSSSTGGRTLGTGGNIKIFGNFTTGTNTYTPGTSTVEFNGSSAQNLSAITLFNLLKSGAGDLNLTGNITVGGFLNVTTGTLNTSSNQITGNATGLLTLAAGTTLTLGSTSSATNVSFPTLFTTGNTTLNCSSTVVYQANTSSQVINNSVTYGNLSVLTGATNTTKALSNSNALTLCGLNTGTGATFNASSAASIQLNGNYTGTGSLQLGSNTMNITGNWTNTGGMTPGTSTVNYTSSSAQTIGAVNYHNLTSSGTGARTLASSGTIGVANTFTPGSNAYTISGSTVSFNGSGAQTIPVFNYFNLSTANTGGRTLATTGNIGIAGNFSPGSNAFTVVNSTIDFNGSGTQTAGGFNFFNLSVNKASGEVQATGNQTLIGTMTLTSGNYNSNGQVFKLKSNATSTARLAAVTGSSQFIGNLSMERYIAAGNTGWAFLGTPVTNSTINDWTDNFATSGFPGSTGFAGGSFVSIYSYNEASTGAASNGYTAPTSGNQSLVNGKGYWVYMGTSFPLTDTITVITTGTPQIGTKDLNVTYTASGGVNEDGWNLVANPFPSTIDWMSSNWDKTNIADGFYVMNRNTRSYASFVNGVGTNGATRYIGSSQGFLVKANGANPVLRVYETAKSSVEPTFLRTGSSNTNETLFRINLTRTGTMFSDESVIRFNEQASTGFDQLLDGLKLNNNSPNAVNISSFSEGIEYSINALPELTNATQIPVKITLPVAGMYTMDFTGIQDLQAAYGQAFGNDYLVLVDNQSGNEINLNTTGSYNFAAAPGDTLKMFTLRFHNPVITQVGQVKTINQEVEMGRDANGLFANFNLKEGQQVEVRLVNAIGQEMEGSRSQWIQQGKIYLNPGVAPEGIYFMQVRYGDHQITEKFKL